MFEAPTKDTSASFTAPSKDIETKAPWYERATNTINSTEKAVGKLIQPVVQPISNVIEKSKNNPLVQIAQKVNLATPPGMIMKYGPKVFSGIQKGADILGEKTATGIAKNFPNVNPQIPAAFGTGVQMAPDIAMSFVNPESMLSTETEGVLPAIEKGVTAIAEKPNLNAAIQLRGKTYVGAPGEIHADVINKMAQELGQSPDKVIDAVQKIGDQGFTNNGKFLTREETRTLTGQRPEAASLLASGKIGPEIPTPKTPLPQFNKSKVPNIDPNKVFAADKALAAMGTPKRLLKDPILLAKAEDHALTLLDAGLIKPFRSPQGMAEELTKLETTSGKKIGSILDTLGEKGKVFDPQAAIKDANSFRPVSRSTGQILKGGAYDTINKKIDNFIETIQAHLPKLPDGSTMNQPISFQEANDLKGVLQGLANYTSNKDATVLDKMLAGKFTQSLDNSLENAASQIGNPELAQEFQKAKKLYGATQFAKDPIYNKISSELTNKKISLTDWILGSHSLATGNPLTGVLEVALKKGFEKYGAGTQAYISNQLSKTPKLIGTANKAYGASMLLRKRK